MGRVGKFLLFLSIPISIAYITEKGKKEEPFKGEEFYQSITTDIQDIELMEPVVGWRELEKSLLKKEEGLRLSPYRDSEGYWTIGYGHHSGRINASTGPWTLEEAEEQFNEDFEIAESAARRAVATFDNLNGCRKGVLVQMAFQMGEGGLRSFVNTIRHINDENYIQAAANMRRSLWARQTPARAHRMAKRMETGEY